MEGGGRDHDSGPRSTEGSADPDIAHTTNSVPQPGADREPSPEEIVDVPDPDEDDLDDLDDMLNDFSAVKIKPAPPGNSPGPAASKPESRPTAEELLSGEEFAKQLQVDMADLLGEMENSPEIQAQFESIFKELGATAPPQPEAPPGAGKSSSRATPAAADADTNTTFQDTIRRTMERMQASGDQATSAATAAGEGSDDFLAELLKQMQAGGLEGQANEEEFSKMLLGMMEQLTNKEILYEPMKELNDKYPDWLEKNKQTVAEEELKRYREQQSLVAEIVAKFEQPTYADSNAADREYIVDRMQRMQAAGSPPADLVGDMPSAQEVFNGPDESCNPQ